MTMSNEEWIDEFTRELRFRLNRAKEELDKAEESFDNLVERSKKVTR